MYYNEQLTDNFLGIGSGKGKKRREDRKEKREDRRFARGEKRKARREKFGKFFDKLTGEGGLIENLFGKSRDGGSDSELPLTAIIGVIIVIIIGIVIYNKK